MVIKNTEYPTINYDEENDVFYFRLSDSKNVYGDESLPGVVIFRDLDTNKFVGATIFDYSQICSRLANPSEETSPVSGLLGDLSKCFIGGYTEIRDKDGVLLFRANTGQSFCLGNSRKIDSACSDFVLGKINRIQAQKRLEHCDLSKAKYFPESVQRLIEFINA